MLSMAIIHRQSNSGNVVTSTFMGISMGEITTLYTTFLKTLKIYFTNINPYCIIINVRQVALEIKFERK